jgi:two-component system C4-dicarboxylate transport sensor histidine kinase DctB
LVTSVTLGVQSKHGLKLAEVERMRIMRLRTVLLLLTTAAVLAAAAVAWKVAHDMELADLAGRADEGLLLKKSNVVTEADRYRYLPSVVAQDDRILKLLDGPDDPIRVDLANRYLETVNRSAGSHDLGSGSHRNNAGVQQLADADNRVGKNYDPGLFQRCGH